MEVAKLVPEEEETRERASSMDVLRILKQRGDKDKWARDVVRGGAQNLAHSLCARVIKTFNAKLKHEGEKALLGCVGRRSDLTVCEVAYSSRQLRLDLRRFVLVFVSRALKMRMNNSIKGNGFVKWTECAHYYVLRGRRYSRSAYSARRSLIVIFIRVWRRRTSYSTEKRAIERDMFVTTLRTHDKFAPRGGKRREKIKDTGNTRARAKFPTSRPLLRHFLVNSIFYQIVSSNSKVFEDVYKNETNGFKVHGQICVNRYTVQFLPSDETITGVTIFLRNISPTFVRKRKVGWTNAEVWISEGFIFSGLDLNVAGELAKMIKVGIAMAT